VYTSILLVVVASLAPGAEIATPTWQTDYSRARQLGTAEHKPLAIVLGTGTQGWENLHLDASARRVLTDSYVPLYIDTDTPKGKQLAESFAMASGQGIVLSDRANTVQAFWHEGTLANPELLGYLQKYAWTQSEPATTETNAVTRTSFYPSAGAAASQVNPAGYLNQGYYQMMQPSYFGGASGGCPNCRR
jgi:hypothetical protein